MALIEDIISDLVESEKSLFDPLLKTKVLASKLRNEELLNWVNKELNGYGQGDVPEYRIVLASVLCTIYDGIHPYHNEPFPIMAVDPKYADVIIKHHFNDSVKTLEAYAKGDYGDTIFNQMGVDFCALISENIQKRGQRFTVESVRKQIHISKVTQVLAEIRSKFLDFILELDSNIPDIDKLLTDKSNNKAINEKIVYIMNQTFNTSGDGNFINTGDKNKIKVNVSVSKGDIESIKKILRENKVEESDITELNEILKSDKPDIENKKLGPKAKGWVQKMISKSLDGTWKIGLDVAGNLLSDSLNNFYGF